MLSLFALFADGRLAHKDPLDCKHAFDYIKEPTIPNFGKDCLDWARLFAENGKYYHAHAGYHTGANLTAACTGYGAYCPGDTCSFQISGEPIITSDEKTRTCHALVPYLWSQSPPEAGNLEPHSGWEYMIATKVPDSMIGSWRLLRFSEIETTFSVPFDWASPSTSDNAWRLDTMEKYSQAQTGECNNDVQPFLTKYFEGLSAANNKTLWRQQGNAVALAAGGICQLAVPYAADVWTTRQVSGLTAEGDVMQQGYKIFTLTPSGKSYAQVTEVVTFVAYQEPGPYPKPPQCVEQNGVCSPTRPCCNLPCMYTRQADQGTCEKVSNEELKAPVFTTGQ